MNVYWILPLIITFGGAAIIAILGKIARKETPQWNLTYAFIAVFCLLGVLGVVVTYYPNLGSIVPSDLYLFNGGPVGSTFRMNELTWWLILVFTVLATIVAIFSIRYMDHDDRLDRYYLLFLTLLGGMIGVVMSGDLLTLFIFWETMSISSYVLVAFRKDYEEPIEAGIKYLFMSAFGSVTLLFGFSLLYGITGTLNLEAIGTAILAKGGFPGINYVIIGALIVGFGVKAAIVPLHLWLPDAHPAAPSGISSILSGVVIMTGTYGLMVTLNLFFGSTTNNVGFVLLWLAVVTMIVGNLMALRQNDIKRLLAFSTVLNVGFILFGLSMSLTGIDATAQILGVQGGWFHVFTHALGKGLAFLCAGAILYRFEERGLDRLEGIGKKMPWTMVAFTLALLSLAGVPPLPGFWSKLYMITAAVTSGNVQYYVGAGIFLLSSVISVVYYLILLQRLWFKEPGEHLAQVTETPTEIVIPLYILVILILVCCYPPSFVDYALGAAQSLLGIV